MNQKNISNKPSQILSFLQLYGSLIGANQKEFKKNKQNSCVNSADLIQGDRAKEQQSRSTDAHKLVELIRTSLKAKGCEPVAERMMSNWNS